VPVELGIFTHRSSILLYPLLRWRHGQPRVLRRSSRSQSSSHLAVFGLRRNTTGHSFLHHRDSFGGPWSMDKSSPRGGRRHFPVCSRGCTFRPIAVTEPSALRSCKLSIALSRGFAETAGAQIRHLLQADLRNYACVLSQWINWWVCIIIKPSAGQTSSSRYRFPYSTELFLSCSFPCALWA